jgi:signal transduction histidine kinase
VTPDPAAQRTRLVDQLTPVLAEINSRLDVGAARRAIVGAARELMGAPAGGFIAAEGDTLVIRETSGFPPSIEGFAFPPGIGALRQSLDTGSPVYIADYHQFPQRAPFLARELVEFNTLVVAPSVVADRIVGAVFVMYRDKEHPVSAAEMEVLNLLGAHGAIATANAQAFAELSIRQQHERDVIDALNDGVAVVSDDGIVSYWSAGAARITGLAADEVVGRSLPLPTGPAGQALQHAIDRDRWIEVRTTRLTDETVVAMRDVTSERELEEARRLFLATTTHEFKTPLTVINGFALTLLSRWDDMPADTRKEALTAIARRGETLMKLIDQLLMGWRADEGSMKVERVPFDLGHVAVTAAAGFEAVSDGHRVIVDRGPEGPLALGDPEAVEQMIGQLLENALKYTPSGTTVSVTVGCDDGRAWVRVADDGDGFPPEDADRIFTRFYRSDRAERSGASGVGLGLHIVKALADAQDGRAQAWSDSTGATFEIALPTAATPS